MDTFDPRRATTFDYEPAVYSNRAQLWLTLDFAEDADAADRALALLGIELDERSAPRARGALQVTYEGRRLGLERFGNQWTIDVIPADEDEWGDGWLSEADYEAAVEIDRSLRDASLAVYARPRGAGRAPPHAETGFMPGLDWSKPRVLWRVDAEIGAGWAMRADPRRVCPAVELPTLGLVNEAEIDPSERMRLEVDGLPTRDVPAAELEPGEWVSGRIGTGKTASGLFGPILRDVVLRRPSAMELERSRVGVEALAAAGVGHVGTARAAAREACAIGTDASGAVDRYLLERALWALDVVNVRPCSARAWVSWWLSHIEALGARCRVDATASVEALPESPKSMVERLGEALAEQARARDRRERLWQIEAGALGETFVIAAPEQITPLVDARLVRARQVERTGG